MHVYQKKRRDFGRNCVFSERRAELIVDINPDPQARSALIAKNPCDSSVLVAKEFSEHEVNTERFETESKGINHTEGGWPKDIDANEVEQVMRYRKKVEKDEAYVQAVLELGNTMEHVIRQNNASNIYEDYFPEPINSQMLDAHTARTISIFRDPNEMKRSATFLSWYPDGPRKLAVAYSVLEFQKAPMGLSFDSYIWDVENPTAPDMTITPASPLVCLEYNPKDVHTLLGGCYNGQIAVWDARKGSRPVDTTPIEKSHRDPVYRARFLQSKTGTEAFSCSTDGQILWWDIRKLSEPTDSLPLDVTKKGSLWGGVCLEYEPTLPTKFMVGTEQGVVVSCNRKGKTVAEKIGACYNAHHGPVYALERNPFYNKYFLSVGDWSSRIWCEDIRESAIMWTKYHDSYLMDACWSPVRPAVYFTAKTDGTLDVWDLLLKTTEASVTLKVSESPLQAIRVQEQGSYIACGGKDGSVTLIELGPTLSKLQPNEKPMTNAIFERETAREKTILSRMREIALKERAKSGKAAPAADAPAEAAAGGDEENAVAQADKSFWSSINADADKKKRKQNATDDAAAEADAKAAAEASTAAGTGEEGFEGEDDGGAEEDAAEE